MYASRTNIRLLWFNGCFGGESLAGYALKENGNTICVPVFFIIVFKFRVCFRSMRSAAGLVLAGNGFHLIFQE